MGCVLVRVLFFFCLNPISSRLETILVRPPNSASLTLLGDCVSVRLTLSARAVDDRHDGDCNDDDGEWTTVDFKDLCVFAACVNIPGCWLLVILFGSPVATGMGWGWNIFLDQAACCT